MNKHPQWRLTDRQQEEAAKKDWVYNKCSYKFILRREADDARIWPHIDGFIHCFVRRGMYVQHKKFIDLSRALDRRFGE